MALEIWDQKNNNLEVANILRFKVEDITKTRKVLKKRYEKDLEKPREDG